MPSLSRHDTSMIVTRISIPASAIAVISFLLAAQVAALLAMGIWSSKQVVWTETFDSRAVFALARDVRRSRRAVGLEDFPGWVGDRKPEEAVGMLALGGRAEIIVGRRYRPLGAGGQESGDENRE